MVTIVGLAGEHREVDGQERHDVDTRHAHALEEAMLHFPTTHIVVDDTHLNTLASLGYQGIGNEKSQGVVLEDVHIDMDMMLGLGNVLQQFREESIAIRHDVHEIVLEG